MYKVICMSFDGDYKTEPREPVESIEAAWEAAENLGSRWYFLPFCFVVTESGKTIADAPSMLERFIGKRVSSVARTFAIYAALPETKGMDVDSFACFIA